MPSSPLNFRAVCGQFVSIFINFMLKRAECKAAMKTVTLKLCTCTDGVLVGLLLSLFYFGHFLILCGDIELNPGPPKTSSTKQTKLTSTRGTRKSSTDSTLPEPSSASQSTSSGPTLRDVMDLLCSMNDSLSEVCDTNETMEKDQPTTTTTIQDTPIPEEGADNDLMALINNINCKFKEMQDNLSKLTNMCAKIQNEVSNVKKDMAVLKNEHEEVKEENAILKDRLECLEKKADHLEFRSKRNNCIFHGICRKNKETSQECEEIIRNLVTEKLDISEPISFDQVCRLNSNSNSPVIASFTFHRQKELVMKAKRKLQGTRIFVSDDLPVRIREIRKNLLPFLKEAKTAGKKAFIVYDHLIIEKKKFYLHQGHLQEQE